MPRMTVRKLPMMALTWTYRVARSFHVLKDRLPRKAARDARNVSDVAGDDNQDGRFLHPDEVGRGPVVRVRE